MPPSGSSEGPLLRVSAALSHGGVCRYPLAYWGFSGSGDGCWSICRPGDFLLGLWSSGPVVYWPGAACALGLCAHAWTCSDVPGAGGTYEFVAAGPGGLLQVVARGPLPVLSYCPIWKMGGRFFLCWCSWGLCGLGPSQGLGLLSPLCLPQVLGVRSVASTQSVLNTPLEKILCSKPFTNRCSGPGGSDW